MREDFPREGQRRESDRVQLDRLIKVIARGDVPIVAQLDRLARSRRDLLNILDTLAKRGAVFRPLAKRRKS